LRKSHVDFQLPGERWNERVRIFPATRDCLLEKGLVEEIASDSKGKRYQLFDTVSLPVQKVELYGAADPKQRAALEKRWGGVPSRHAPTSKV